MPDAQAIVVGGGPAGSATAALLAREGHEVLLLDRARFPRDKACAEYLSPATADALARIGALARVEAQGPARPLGMHLIMRGGSRALVRYPDGTSSRRAMCLSRRVLDATLLDYARDCGVQVLEGWQVHHVVSGPGGSTVDARPVGEPAGARRRLAASLLVGADGTRSVVARSLGLERPLPWPNRVGLVAHVRGVDGLQEYGEMYVGRGAYCGLAPLPAGLTNVGLVLDARLYRKPAGLEGAYRVALERLPGRRRAWRGPGGSVLCGAWPPSPGASRVPRGTGICWWGMPAGFLDPFTGEGVFRALRGAELAAEAAFRGLAPGGCLRRCAGALSGGAGGRVPGQGGPLRAHPRLPALAPAPGVRPAPAGAQAGAASISWGASWATTARPARPSVPPSCGPCCDPSPRQTPPMNRTDDRP